VHEIGILLSLNHSIIISYQLLPLLIVYLAGHFIFFLFLLVDHHLLLHQFLVLLLDVLGLARALPLLLEVDCDGPSCNLRIAPSIFIRTYLVPRPDLLPLFIYFLLHLSP
jgi:hypothetical protein